MFKILIACYGNWDTTAEIPFIFKKAGCSIDVYCSNKSWLLSNSYFENWIESDSDENIYSNVLISLASKNSYDWIILADDLVINLMNNKINNEELFLKLLPLTKIQNRYMLSSKKGLSDFCISHGIDTPGFCMYNNSNDLDTIKNTLNFPVINKINFSFGGTDMFISSSFEVFESNLYKIPKNQNIFIQEFIKGEEISVEALFYKGELVTYLNSNVLNYSSTIFSYTTRRTYYENIAIKPLLVDLGTKLGLNGFASIIYLYQQEKNKFYLIEVDPRPNSWMANSRFISNNNFITGIKKIVNGDYKNGFQSMKIKNETVEVALFYKDIRRAIWQKDWQGIYRWILNKKGYWKFLPFYDFKLSKRIFREIWKEVVITKWNKTFGRKGKVYK